MTGSEYVTHGVRLFIAVLPMLFACGGSVHAPPDLTVRGMVLNQQRLPAPNARVQINALPAQTTDAEGRFETPGVPDTYDIAIVATDLSGLGGHPGANRAVVYRGLHRRDPRLYLPGLRAGGAQFQSVVIGPVSLTGMPAGSRFSFLGFVDSRGVVDVASSFVSWFGELPMPGRLVALAGDLNAAGALQPALTGAGSVPLTISGDKTPLVISIAATAPLEIAITVTLRTASSFI